MKVSKEGFRLRNLIMNLLVVANSLFAASIALAEDDAVTLNEFVLEGEQQDFPSSVISEEEFVARKHHRETSSTTLMNDREDPAFISKVRVYKVPSHSFKKSVSRHSRCRPVKKNYAKTARSVSFNSTPSIKQLTKPVFRTTLQTDQPTTCKVKPTISIRPFLTPRQIAKIEIQHVHPQVSNPVAPFFSGEGHVYISGSASASWLTMGNSNPQINYYNGLLNDAYPLNRDSTNALLLSLQSGYEWSGVGNRPSIALGLGIYQTPKTYGYKGQLIETPLGGPPSTLYNYKFTVSNTRAMVEAQLTGMIEHVTPFVNIGIGPTWVRLKDYAETPVNSSGYVVLPAFQAYTNINFAYQIGFGIGYAFNMKKSDCDLPEYCSGEMMHERVLLGYRHAGLGNASFGTRGSLYPYKLNLGSLRSDDIYLSYTYLF